MHTGPVPGKYTSNWEKCNITNPRFRCRCGSKNIMFRLWESSCGGYDDVNYKCLDCERVWWVESSDS